MIHFTSCVIWTVCPVIWTGQTLASPQHLHCCRAAAPFTYCIPSGAQRMGTGQSAQTVTSSPLAHSSRFFTLPQFYISMQCVPIISVHLTIFRMFTRFPLASVTTVQRLPSVFRDTDPPSLSEDSRIHDVRTMNVTILSKTVNLRYKYGMIQIGELKNESRYSF